MDYSKLDILSVSYVLIPLAIYFAFSLIRGGRIHSLNITNPTVALDTVRDHICDRIATFFSQVYGQDFRLPDGLSIEDVGEHIYSGITDLATLQQIFVDLLSQGVQSPHFINAFHFVMGIG